MMNYQKRRALFGEIATMQWVIVRWGRRLSDQRRGAEDAEKRKERLSFPFSLRSLRLCVTTSLLLRSGLWSLGLEHLLKLLMPTLSDQDMMNYQKGRALFGETAAMQWVVVR